jgi:hypothetical protein
MEEEGGEEGGGEGGGDGEEEEEEEEGGKEEERPRLQTPSEFADACVAVVEVGSLEGCPYLIAPLKPSSLSRP